MKVLQTLDGTKYTLKVLSRTFNDPVYAGNALVLPALYVNLDVSLGSFYSATPEVINISTAKRIIPLELNFSAFIGATPTMSISSVYFNYANYPATATVNNGNAISALCKNIAYAKLNYYSSPNNYSYFIDYNNIVYTDSDFIQPQGAIFPFSPFLNMVNSINGFYNIATAGNLPAGDLASTITILYFEML